MKRGEKNIYRISIDIYLRVKTNNVRNKVAYALIQTWIVILIFNFLIYPNIFRSKWSYFNWILFYSESLKI